jgi:hypothetical protein
MVEARFAWLALVVILPALIFALRPQTSEPSIRLTGLFLQLLGIATVIWGISETREFFGHPSFFTKTKKWFGKCQLLGKSVIATANIGALSLATLNARAHSSHGPGPNPTIETRIDSLERNIALLHERISGTEKEMDDEFGKILYALKNEEQARQTEDKIIHEKLEATGTGGMHISAIGASWLFVGVILSTAGIEIAELLK